MRQSTSTIPITCNRDCGGGCPLLAHVEDGRIVRISDNPLGGPFMHGCIRGYQAMRTLYASERLKRPLLRQGPRGSGQFREVGWDQALAWVATRLSDLESTHGAESIIRLGGSGSCRGALHNTSLLTARFLSLFGGYTETQGNYSSQAASFVTPFVLGTNLAGIDAGTLQSSNLIVLWGANIVDCRLGCETEARIRQARNRGVEVIVIDPRRTETVKRLGTQWIPVHPGTDVALMMAVLYVWIDEGLIEEAFVERYSVGFADLARAILGMDGGVPKTPQWAEGICGTSAGTILRFARQYGRTKPAALMPGLSIQRTIGGEEAIRMSIALQVASGNFGLPGGSSGGLIWNRLPGPGMPAISAPAPLHRVSVPVYHWPDAVLEGKAGGYPSDIKAIYNVGGNYLVQGSDVRKNVRALEKVEFSVCHDFFLTPTARYCDVVLPSTTFLERQDIVFPEANFLLFSNRAVPPLHEARSDYDIFCHLADRLGVGDAYSEGMDEEAWLRTLVTASEVPDYDEFKRTGIYMGRDQFRVGLSEFIADPHANPLQTPSGRIELSSAAYARTGFAASPQCRMLADDPTYPLRLVTPKSRYRVHSQNANILWFAQREAQVLWMHPLDATQRALDEAQEVLVRNREGVVRIKVHVTEDVMPGVVCLLEGAWPCLDTDSVDTGGSPNMLTSTVPTMPSHGSRTHSVLVQVEAARETGRRS